MLHGIGALHPAAEGITVTGRTKLPCRRIADNFLFPH